ncbi:MAG: hypothetical protein UR93_C0035G0011, partial [Berkelbacteria bacterium GW2011_GWA2_35_9]
MQRNIQKLVEAEILFLKRLIIGFIIFSISIPNILYAQSTAPTSPTSQVTGGLLRGEEKSQFPAVPPASFEALDTAELTKNANLILDELEFLLADKNPRIVLNSYDKKIINDYYTLSKNEELIKQIGTNDTRIIDEFVTLYESTEAQTELTVDKKAETLLKHIDSIFIQLSHPLVQSNFGLA